MKTQSEVNEYFKETEKMVGETKTEYDAIKLLKRIIMLYNHSEDFFIPLEISEYEKFALSLIKSSEAIFESIIYPERVENYDDMICQLITFEVEVLNGESKKEEYFEYLEIINREVRQFNKFCEMHNCESMKEFTIKDEELQKNYEEWRLKIDVNDLEYILNLEYKIRILKLLYHDMLSSQEIAGVINIPFDDIDQICDDLANKGFIEYSTIKNKVYKIGIKGIKVLYKMRI